MRSLVCVMLVATTAHAGPAQVTIEKHDRPVSVRIGAGPWQKVPENKSVAAPPIAAPAGGKAIAIEVQSPTGSKGIRRLAVVLPDLAYRIVGNPCAFWGLEVDVESEGEARIQIDASAISRKLFPLSIDASFESTVLEAPGTSEAVEMLASAMCSRSGTHVVVTAANKRKLFDANVIPHPGALHTLRLVKGSFTITVAR